MSTNPPFEGPSGPYSMKEIIEALAASDEEFACSRMLFAVVNRTLNEHGHRGSITAGTSYGVVLFKVVKS